MKQPIGLLSGLFALVVLSGCSDDLSALDAVVTGPADSTFTVGSPGGGSSFVRPIDFQVTNSTGVPLVEVEVELFANGGGTLVDLNGALLDPGNPFYFKTKTDDRGLARTAFLINLPASAPTTGEDITVTAGVTASVGVASAVWTATYTVKKTP